jgi:hypothetical protein
MLRICDEAISQSCVFRRIWCSSFLWRCLRSMKAAISFSHCVSIIQKLIIYDAKQIKILIPIHSKS